MGTIIVLIVLSAIVAAAVYSLRKRKKNGGGCGCGCSGCAMSDVCHKDK